MIAEFRSSKPWKLQYWRPSHWRQQRMICLTFQLNSSPFSMLFINCKSTHCNIWWYFFSQTNKSKQWADNLLTELDSFWNWGWIELAWGRRCHLFEDSTILADKEIRFGHWTGRWLESRGCSSISTPPTRWRTRDVSHCSFCHSFYHRFEKSER